MRRSAKAIKLIAGEGEPAACFCGSVRFSYEFTRFPMEHVSRCEECGFEHRCGIQPTPVKKAPRAEPPPPESPGWPPFFYGI